MSAALLAGAIAGTYRAALREIRQGVMSGEPPARVRDAVAPAAHSKKAPASLRRSEPVERWAGLAPASPHRKWGAFPWTTNASPTAIHRGRELKIKHTACGRPSRPPEDPPPSQQLLEPSHVPEPPEFPPDLLVDAYRPESEAFVEPL